MTDPSWKKVVFVIFGLIALVWLLLSLYALAEGFVGGDPLYIVIPGHFLAQYSLLGKVYLVASALLPFVVIGALILA
jgi:hypothetical protein